MSTILLSMHPNGGGVRKLRKEIDSLLYEHTAIATKPDELVKRELAELRDDNVMSPDLVFKSPYSLEFTGLKGMYSEKIWRIVSLSILSSLCLS